MISAGAVRHRAQYVVLPPVGQITSSTTSAGNMASDNSTESPDLWQKGLPGLLPWDHEKAQHPLETRWLCKLQQQVPAETINGTASTAPSLHTQRKYAYLL